MIEREFNVATTLAKTTTYKSYKSTLSYTPCSRNTYEAALTVVTSLPKTQNLTMLVNTSEPVSTRRNRSKKQRLGA